MQKSKCKLKMYSCVTLRNLKEDESNISCFPRFSWRHQLREFKSEFRVVAVDMRGYGESDLPSSTESYRLDYLVTDIKDIVEYLGESRLLSLSQPHFTFQSV